MHVHKSTHGTVCITNPDQQLFFLKTLKIGLELEIKTGGRMRLTRGPKCTTRARKILGLKGNAESLLRQVNDLIVKRTAEVNPTYSED